MDEFDTYRVDEQDERRERGIEDEHQRHVEELLQDRLREHVTPDPRPAKRAKRSDISKPDERFREQVFERDTYACLVHENPKDCEWPPAAHHVVKAQVLRRNGHGNAVYDPRSAMTVCSLAHRQHHSRSRPIRLDEIPASVFAFLCDLGYEDWMLRHYPAPSEAA